MTGPSWWFCVRALCGDLWSVVVCAWQAATHPRAWRLWADLARRSVVDACYWAWQAVIRPYTYVSARRRLAVEDSENLALVVETVCDIEHDLAEVRGMVTELHALEYAPGNPYMKARHDGMERWN